MMLSQCGMQRLRPYLNKKRESDEKNTFTYFSVDFRSHRSLDEYAHRLCVDSISSVQYVPERYHNRFYDIAHIFCSKKPA